ncbi:MAG: transglutaminase, partial [Betaproteobacteria bacterium]|nr:transglutaminase [Betaproteobacteria bacterium]
AEAVIGVRFRAWRPASALHPSIGIHAPLQIDLVDNVLGRSLGGCRYHVTHPGGRNYERPPVNASEAESRRLSRFVRFEHSPGEIRLAAARPSLEFPFTLDLRQS